MPFVADFEITAHMEVAPGHYRHVLHAPDTAANATAGQFCMLEDQEGFYPFLRPMCFEKIFRDSISILYKVEGEGTDDVEIDAGPVDERAGATRPALPAG